jgi:hypothetical protein
VVQVVEHLPCRHKALSSKPSTTKKKGAEGIFRSKVLLLRDTKSENVAIKNVVQINS